MYRIARSRNHKVSGVIFTSHSPSMPVKYNPEDVQKTLDKHIEAGNLHTGWEELWAQGDDLILPWDKRKPNPTLEEVLTTKRATIGGPLFDTTDGGSPRRKKALVPGCGRGVDVLLLASFGYDAYGLEYSKSAFENCKKEEEGSEERYPVRDASFGRGKVTWIQGDFFGNDWVEKLGLEKNSFDLIYDYTFFCAFPPSMRPAWSLRHTQLLAPSPQGNLVCLEFPRHKDPLQHGPPYGSPSEAYMEHLSHPGEEIPYDAKGRCKSDLLREPSALGLERVAYWQPAATHDFGTGEEGEVYDRVSIWRRR
ncbi:S-adenosyl-L-methionine-dependent methyltransferase [Aspergillus karnatakaensis]|uniref:putative thiol methyltransferase n=1 Tax=Aspergillus karnatakaensis TaxID=1810916 RepID=UPI003CCDAB24